MSKMLGFNCLTRQVYTLIYIAKIGPFSIQHLVIKNIIEI